IPGLELIGTSINHIIQPQQREENAVLQTKLGFRFVEDKWAGLSPYRYSLAIENFSGPDYWTEKLADCYLAWTLPIYYGCTNIEEYFPPESFIRINIEKPDEAMDIIRRVLFDDPWPKRIEAIREARRRVLEHHQLFPSLVRFLRTLSGSTQESSRWSSIFQIPSITPSSQFRRKPEISVIVCTYNRAELLEKCLQSLAGQSLPATEYEVIIIDNHSSDTTLETAKLFLNNHPNFSYFMENRQGLSHARNLGVTKSRGDYLAFIDDDSMADHNWLSEALSIIRSHHPDIFGGAVYPLLSNTSPLWYHNRYGIRGDMGETGWIDQGFIIGTNIFFHRSLLSEYGGFNPRYGMIGEQLGYHEETDLVLRAFSENRKVYFSRDLLVFDTIPEYKKSLAYFILSKYQAGCHGLNLWNPESKADSIRSVLILLKQTMQEFNDALMKRDTILYPYPENYLIERKILKRFFQIGLMSEFFLQQDDNHPETT
ncbi:MAG: glycosyltransferase, partial [Candidatus Delongbacteria bacterium]|nr:glycosyltransferase [Candidatus Delongbacteria bacterium]